MQKTSLDGVYAAGDICIKPLRQVVTAVGDGALAASELERYAARQQKITGLHPRQPVSPVKQQEPEAAAAAPTAGQLFTNDMKLESPLPCPSSGRGLTCHLHHYFPGQDAESFPFQYSDGKIIVRF